MAEHAHAWEELQQAGAQPAEPTAGVRKRVTDWWREASPRRKSLMVFAVLLSLALLGMVAGGAVVVVGKALRPKPQPNAAAVASTPAPTATFTPTPAPTATPTPTPLPRLVVWSPSGECAYVRSGAGIDNDPDACVPNGTEVIDLGVRKEGNGYTWAKVQYPTKNGYVSVGWMATRVVAWAIQPDKVTGNRKAPFYRKNKAAVMLYLPPHTPLIVLQDDGDGWLWVQLPNGRKGFVKARDLEK